MSAPIERVAVGDILQLAPSLPPAQCIVTSPPYWGLRKYPIAPSLWGGDPNCRHNFASTPPPRQGAANDHGGGKHAKGSAFDATPTQTCRKCGAWRGQLGQEPTPDLFVSHLADIFQAIPLANDGVLFVNIRDTGIAGKGKSGRADAARGAQRRAAGQTLAAAHSNVGGAGVVCPADNMRALRGLNLKPKDLACIPWRLALAMQERGFYYRQEITWLKTNPLPESVQDRLPVRTEKILMFSRSKRYYFNRNAILVPCQQSTMERYERGRSGQDKYSTLAGAQRQHGLSRRKQGAKTQVDDNAPPPPPSVAERRDHKSLGDVWEMPTSSSRQKHIAPMPLELPRRCILLATRPGDVVCDPFAGTGTTLAAAKMEKRGFVGVDIDPNFRRFVRETMRIHQMYTPLLQ